MALLNANQEGSGIIAPTVDPTLEFANITGGPENPDTISDGVVYSLAKLVAENGIGWAAVDRFGAVVRERAKYHYDALTQG